MMPGPRQDAQIPSEGVDIIDPPDGRRAHVRFQGPFEGHTVTWDAVIMTLHEACAVGADHTVAAGSFMEVGADQAGVTSIRIGLDVDRVDWATVHKAVIMVRRYKRLRRGRHEFGTVRGGR